MPISNQQVDELWAKHVRAYANIYGEVDVSGEYSFAEAIEAEAVAATLATVTPLVQLALEEIDDGEEHAQDCMTRYGGYPCRCQKQATIKKLRAFLSGATKESTDHGQDL